MPKKRDPRLLEEIENAESDLTDLKAKFLKQAGWAYECINARWFWVKEFEGRTFAMDEAAALKQQELMDLYNPPKDWPTDIFPDA